MRRELGQLDRQEPDTPSLDGAAQVDRDLDVEVDGALREACWLAFDTAGAGGWRPEQTQWSAGARAALGRALVEAAGSGAVWAGPSHLLHAVLADPDNRAGRLLHRCDIDPSVLFTAAARAAPGSANDEPRTPLAGDLRRLGVIPSPGRSGFTRLLTRVAAKTLTRATEASVVLYGLELEAIRQTVRLAHSHVTTAHLVLATLALDDQLTTAGLRLPDDIHAVNAAGSILASHGITYRTALSHLADMSLPDDTAPPRRRRPWNKSPRNPPWATDAADAADLARHEAAQHHVDAGSGHVLLAALAQPDGPAAELLRGLGADPVLVREQASASLAQSPTA